MNGKENLRNNFEFSITLPLFYKNIEINEFFLVYFLSDDLSKTRIWNKRVNTMIVVLFLSLII